MDNETQGDSSSMIASQKWHLVFTAIHVIDSPWFLTLQYTSMELCLIHEISYRLSLERCIGPVGKNVEHKCQVYVRH